jgi:hypothetical protein
MFGWLAVLAGAILWVEGPVLAGEKVKLSSSAQVHEAFQGTGLLLVKMSQLDEISGRSDHFFLPAGSLVLSNEQLPCQ